MADHFALMTGRLITESTLRSAAAAVPSTTDGYDDQTDPHVVAEDVQLAVGGAKSGVMVECRICQEEGDEAYMETPCSCKGSLKASFISSASSLRYPMKLHRNTITAHTTFTFSICFFFQKNRSIVSFLIT
jgi:hypothetical protein